MNNLLTLRGMLSVVTGVGVDHVVLEKDDDTAMWFQAGPSRMVKMDYASMSVSEFVLDSRNDVVDYERHYLLQGTVEEEIARRSSVPYVESACIDSITHDRVLFRVTLPFGMLAGVILFRFTLRFSKCFSWEVAEKMLNATDNRVPQSDLYSSARTPRSRLRCLWQKARHSET